MIFGQTEGSPYEAQKVQSMTELTMQEACNKLTWYGSWSDYTKYDAEKKELILEMEWFMWENDNEPAFLDGEKGMIVFYGVSHFQIKPILPSERTFLKFILSGCLFGGTRKGLSLEGYAYKETQTESYDWFTLRFFADSATWYPKTNHEEPKTNN